MNENDLASACVQHAAELLRAHVSLLEKVLTDNDLNRKAVAAIFKASSALDDAAFAIEEDDDD